MNNITDQEKHDCATRELAMRRRVYPGLVARGRMAQSEADREIAVMAAIVSDYHHRTGLFG